MKLGVLIRVDGVVAIDRARLGVVPTKIRHKGIHLKLHSLIIVHVVRSASGVRSGSRAFRVELLLVQACGLLHLLVLLSREVVPREWLQFDCSRWLGAWFHRSASLHD